MRLAANKKIEMLYDTEVTEVLGTSEPKGVTGIRLRNTVTGSARDEQVWTGCSSPSAIRRPPQLFKGKLDMDASGYIKTAPIPRIPVLPASSLPATSRIRYSVRP